MARKQKDYLTALLADEIDGQEAEATTGEPEGVPTPRTDRARRNSLLGRESALARVASGEVRQVTQIALDPARVRPWAGNARSYNHLNEENCRELIDAIVAEGGQKVPAIVRRVDGDPAFEFEVIAGTRRHWSISWLRQNSYPDMKFLAQVADLDDEAAFRLADIENRARKDVSDLERAQALAKLAFKDDQGCNHTRRSRCSFCVPGRRPAEASLPTRTGIGRPKESGSNPEGRQGFGSHADAAAQGGEAPLPCPRRHQGSADSRSSSTREPPDRLEWSA
jgi:ParB family chromosome partitioning protein